MTILTLARAPRRDGAVFAAGLGAAVISLLVGVAVSDPGLARIAVAVPVACLLVGIGTNSPRVALYGLMVWLVALGLVRRMLTTVGSTSPFGDPLLLVGSAILLTLFAIAVERGALRDQTRLSRAVMWLTVVLALSAINPLQGGLTVGLGGVMLVVVPMLTFWVGRSLLDDRAVRILVGLLATLALLAAIYGLAQTFVGMPSWDQRWIGEVQHRYVALRVGGTIRAFGTSSSSAEYAALLAVGIMSWRAIAMRASRLPVAAAAIAVIATALWFESARTIVVLTLAALWLTFAASRHISIGRALPVGAVLLAVLPTVVGVVSSARVSSARSNRTGTSALVTHQVEGLSEPFGQGSTLGGHFERITNGIAEGFTSPVGRGVGATTIAASKFEGTSAGTEADLGNAPVAAGLIGLILYLLVAVYGIKASYRLAQERRTVSTVAALGIVVATFMQWLNGGQYAIVLLPWLFLGWVDAASRTANPLLPTDINEAQPAVGYATDTSVTDERQPRRNRVPAAR